MNSKTDQLDVFNRDVENNCGYRYTTNIGLSSRLATSNSFHSVTYYAESVAGKNLIDIGCGDGFYTLQYFDQVRPKSLTAIDGAKRAIDLATRKKAGRNISFLVGDFHKLPFKDDSFDMALLQAILHHDENPLQTIREALRVAPKIIIHEPNGNNLGLKIIEKFSPYHREHHEKSYTHMQIKKWLDQANADMKSIKFTGLVPMFCPDWMAQITNRLKPVMETIPVLNLFTCAVFTIFATRTSTKVAES